MAHDQRYTLNWTYRISFQYASRMTRTDDLEDLARKLAAAMPSGLGELRQDVENNIQSVLQAWLSQMNLVTRQEFDAQSAVLKRTQDKLQQLEHQLQHLEETSAL